IFFLFSLSALFFCSFIPQKDKRYCDYFMHEVAASLYKEQGFKLLSLKIYYSWKHLDHINLSFSVYRNLSKKDARILMIDTVNYILDQVNNDPLLIEKNLLQSGHFCMKQLTLTITADNVFGNTIDSVNVRTMTLDGGIITYETFPWSAFLPAGVEKYRESYRDALLLVETPTPSGVSEEIEMERKNAL